MNLHTIQRTVKNELQALFLWFKYQPLNRSPHGHFYSPVVSKKEIDHFSTAIFGGKTKDSIPGINLHTDKQISLLNSFLPYYQELPFSEHNKGTHRYYLKNSSFEYTDGIILHSFIRHFKPRRIIEIGSGFSSSLMLDIKDLFLHNLELLFIEPFPDVLDSLINKQDRTECRVLNNKVQDIPVAEFKCLEENDILFIDSSHVSKTGSDVNYEIFSILPELNPGVLIHFHDIFYPFEYPEEWVYEGRNWNEAYILRALLSGNTEYQIELFPHYLHLHHPSAFTAMPLSYKNPGGSIWVRKQ